MIQEVQSSQMTATVDPTQFTFADWLAIARQLGNEDKWAFYKWKECYTQLNAVSLDEWFEIANALGYSRNWAFQRYDEFSAA